MRMQLSVCVFAALVVHGAANGGPVPINTSGLSITYQTAAGSVEITGTRDFNGVLGSQAPLGDSGNIAAFNSAGNTIGVFGRRTAPILLANPSLPPVFGPNESLVSHAFFKIDNNQEFFPGLTPGTNITLSIDHIQFTEPATIVEDTLLMHTKWRPEQVNAFANPDDAYIQLDDHHTITDSFRDFDTFLDRIFFDQPVPNYLLNDPNLGWTITGNGTTDISLSFTLPYEIFRNFEDTGQTAPAGFPAPQGFLEPFHFHIEYVVVPEPTSLTLLCVGGLLMLRGRRRKA